MYHIVLFIYKIGVEKSDAYWKNQREEIKIIE